MNNLKENKGEICDSHYSLFSTINTGTLFWKKEYEKYGCHELWERIQLGAYVEKLEDTQLGDRVKEFNLDKSKELLIENDSFFISTEDDLWPNNLNDSPIPPIGLIVKGNEGVLRELKNSIGVVGTRNPTRYGERIASDFASTFSDHNWITVSGGALGIDAAVHRGSLMAEGKTVAVLASPIENHYPKIHHMLFEHITHEGLLITETPFGWPTLSARFLHRNRIIAALTKGVVVIEAPYRSGALRTAHDAIEIMRPVFATPGPITSPASEGVHQLIIERKAELVVSALDLISLLN